MATRT